MENYVNTLSWMYSFNLVTSVSSHILIFVILKSIRVSNKFGDLNKAFLNSKLVKFCGVGRIFSGGGNAPVT